MASEEVQFKKMVNTPVKKLVVTLGIPTTISMLVTSIYNMADTFFVAQIDKDGAASAAVGIVFSIMAIIQAIGFMIGMGSGNLISSLLGEKKNDEAQIVGSSGFYSGLFIGLLITTFTLVFMTPILTFLKASPSAMGYARDYATYIAIGAPIMVGSFIMNNLLRAEGKARFSMIGLTTGGILNMLLDPLFIFVFKLNTKGAAIATLIGQSVSFLILLYMFLSHKSIIKLSFKCISKKFKTYSEIVKLGFPSFCRQALASIASVFMNRQAGILGGDACQAAISIVTKCCMFIFSASLGMWQGFQPVCGYNYFSKHYKRVKEALIFTFLLSTFIMTFFGVLFIVFAKQLMQLFNAENQDVINIGVSALRWQCYSFPIMSINTVCNMTYQSMRKKFQASLLSCLRQGIFFMPLIFILPAIYGLSGVEMVQGISDILTSLVSIPFLISILSHLNKKIKEQDLLTKTA